MCLSLRLPLPAAILGAALLLPLPAAAQVDRLVEAMRLDEVIAIMRDEGVDYGRSLDADLLSNRGGLAWEAAVERVYDEAAMLRSFTRALQDELAERPEVVAAAMDFATSDLGREVIGLEISAREAMLDDDIDAAARAASAAMLEQGGSRVALLEEFIALNDLLEQNVAGALNANLAFYFAFVDAGGLSYDITADQILSDVRAQEETVRAETRDWLFAYLGLAYSPLGDEALRAYLDVSASPEGRALNRALFAAYDVMFTMMSQDLGAAAGARLTAQDL